MVLVLLVCMLDFTGGFWWFCLCDLMPSGFWYFADLLVLGGVCAVELRCCHKLLGFGFVGGFVMCEFSRDCFV